MKTKTRYYFCIDGGGTKTRGVLMDSAGGIVAKARAGPTNLHTDFDLGIANIKGLWNDIGRAGGVSAGGIRAADTHFALGAAGLDFHEFRHTVAGHFTDFATITQVSDGYAALIGASNGAPAGLIAVGTGVIAFRISRQRRVIVREGWSWVGGDRGSGMWIGRRGLYAYLQAHDMATPLTTPLFSRLGRAVGFDRQEIFSWLGTPSPARLAELAPLVLAAARDGDETAQDIVDEAVLKIVATINALCTPRDDPLYVVGGIGLALRAQIEAALGRCLDEPQHDQTHGLYLIARGEAPADCALEYPTRASTAKVPVR